MYYEGEIEVGDRVSKIRAETLKELEKILDDMKLRKPSAKLIRVVKKGT